MGNRNAPAVGAMDEAARDADSTCGVNDVGSPKSSCPKDRETPGHLRVKTKYRNTQHQQGHPALPNAKIALAGPGGPLARNSKPDGEAVFRDLKPGSYTLKASHADCVEAAGNGHVISSQFTETEVVLEPLGTIRGRVVIAGNPDKKVNGIAGAVVQIEGRVETVATSATGEFQFKSRLLSGQYQLRVSKNGYAGKTFDVTAAFKPGESIDCTISLQAEVLKLVKVDDYFCPKQESLEISYRLQGYSSKPVHIEVTSSHYSKKPIFLKELSAAERTNGDHRIQWDGKTTAEGDLKDHYIHPLFSPYKVRLTDGKTSDDLEFKVLYHSIELRNGPWTADEKEPSEADEKAWVAYQLNQLGYYGGPVGKDTDQYLKKAIVRYKANHVKFHQKFAPSYDDKITPELKAALKAKENDRKLEPLKAIEDRSKMSTVLVECLGYEKLTATTDEFGDTRPPHEKKRLNRPIIPLEATIYIKKKDGSKALEPEAVGPARINWRFQDPNEDLSPQLEPTADEPSQTKKFIEKSLHQKNGRTGTNGDNCPKDFAGIREAPATNYRTAFFLGDVYVPYTAKEDKSAKTIFSKACVDKNKFPKRFGKAGIFLRPSYIAGDDYKYSAEIGFEGLPNKAALEKLHGITADEKTKIKAETGLLVVRRFGRVAMSIDWPARTNDYEWDKIATEFGKCFLDVDVKNRKVKKLSDVITPEEYKKIVTKNTKHKNPGTITLLDDAMVGVTLPAQGNRNADQYKKFLKKFCNTEYNELIQTPLGDKLSEVVRKTDPTGFIILNFLLHKPVDIKTDPKNGKNDVTASNRSYITWGGSIGLSDSTILLDQKDPDKVYYVVSHEMGHNLYLLHWENTGENNIANHDRNDHNCTLSYSDFSFKKAGHFKHQAPGKFTPHFCGKCNLAVRGWDITRAGVSKKSKTETRDYEHPEPDVSGALASVTIEVVNESGKPVSGAEVELVGLRMRNTDSAGKVKYSELDPGQVDLKVRKRNYGPKPSSGQAWEPGEYWEYKHLSAGANTFRVVMIKKTARLLVKVQTPNGKPVNKAEVEIVGINKKNTGADGRADFGEMPAKTYDIKVRKTDYGPVPSSGAKWVAGEHQEYRALPVGNEDPVIVKMTRGVGFLSVVVKTPSSHGGKPIESAEVELVGVNKKNTGKDGKADFGEVDAGRYDIKVRKTNYGPEPASGTPFQAGEFQVYKQVDVAQVVSVPVTMVNGIGTLTIAVLTPEGKPVEKAEVELVGYAKKNTNAKGEAVFAGLEAKKYDVKARKKFFGNPADPVNLSEDQQFVVLSPSASHRAVLHLKKYYAVDLVVQRASLTLKHDNQSKLEVKVEPADAVVAEYRMELKRVSGGGWFPIGNARKLSPWTARIAGKFKIRGVAKIAGNDVVSSEKDMEVQFPTYSQIVGDSGVRTAVSTAWRNTLNDCTSSPNQRREHGFWIYVNTTANTYEFGPTVHGAFSGPAGGASVNLPPRPPDSPAAPSPDGAGATYPVASFHTHTPTEFRATALPGAARGVGPSGADNTADNTDDVPGVVFDFVESPAGSGSIPMGHPKTSAALLYHSRGKTRRTTPP